MAYTNIDDPSAHFQTTLYTGNNTGGASNTITNDGNSDLQPDWVWIKSRSGTSNHNCSDSSRGATKHLAQNITYQEEIVSGITAYNSDGFTVGSNNDANLNGATFVAWQWKANGGTTASNTDGNITSTVQANQDAGFSIGTYTGAGGTKTIGHGLNVAPEFFIIKRRDAAADWLVHPTFIDGTLDYLWLNLTNAALNAGEPLPTNSVFTVPDVAWANASGGTYVFYAFHSVQGYSKFGKYVGNGNANGPFIYTGFKPAFLLVKITTASGYDWRLVDSARNTFNLTDKLLMPNNNSAEFDGSTHASNMGFDFVSNGFKLRTTYTGMNGNTETFIYMAFAENPFTTSTGIPTTAR
jgi:hypothetical protein